MTTDNLPATALELRSTVGDDATVTVAVTEREVAAPGDDQVVVRVEAAPVNPSDMGVLFAGGDVTAAEAVHGSQPAVQLPLNPAALRALQARVGRAMPAGNEGAGTVVAAGSSERAQALLGKVVGFLSGNAYAEYRTLHVEQCLPMRSGTTAEQAASAFVNPLTALGMVETMRAEGHTALVHTVGASNLGLMLNRICIADGVPLVNLVRRPEQAELLRAEGAEHIVDTSADDFPEGLVAALKATGATIAFDAIGGGTLADTLLRSMERALSDSAEQFSTYGSAQLKQVYTYGGLDRSPTVLKREYGMAWAVGGWLLTPFLIKIGPEAGAALRQRVADEITTTFASSYAERLGLADVVDPTAIARYARIATGAKALVTPNG
ncbi:MAG TPA: zinc-binding dehydrogenase [Ilumatobacter sp.]|nr:zinc-binding dehydrogenase [Ilumatobacter sp.]